ncbi:hypothetical protein [Stella sp.]|uniref:hypothetical protein n=1 Tax=Stella sp. TaxID=2912054 RepID=UPI0035B20313
MKTVRDYPGSADGAVTRFLLLLIAVGASLMLLGGALVPTGEADGGALGLEAISASVERLRAFLGG